MAMLQNAAQQQPAAAPPQAGPPQAGPPQAGPPQAGAPGQDLPMEPGAAAPGVEGGPEAVNPEGEVEAGEPATPEEQAEYERVMNAVQKVVYENDETSDAVIKMVQPDNKVESTVAATVLLLHQLDSKLDMDESVIAQVTQDLADIVVDLAENAYGIQYSERDLQNILGATWENVMDIYGADEEGYNEFMSGMSPEQQKQQGEVYKQFVGD
jgi:hypothetical protein